MAGKESDATGEKERLLRERARALAREPITEARGERLEVLEFSLSYERYGVELAYVREVYPLREFTPVPCTPPFVLGVVNVRGEIFSVVDIKKVFELPDRGLTELNRVIILEADEMKFGILADAIEGVREVDPTTFQPPLVTLTGIREEFLRGVTAERVVILDAGKLLSGRLTVHEEVD